jgi:hypothetical protein
MPISTMPSAIDRQTRKHYGAIGKVAVEWTRFESYLAETVRMLAGVDNKYGECITAQIINVDQLLDALSALVDLRSPGAADELQFKKRLERIQSIAERRDQVVHDVWTFDPGTTTRWPSTVRKRYSPGPVNMPTSEVEALAVDVENLSVEFLTFRREFLMLLHLWPGQ